MGKAFSIFRPVLRLFFIILPIYSCSKDSSSPFVSINEPIINGWELSSINFDLNVHTTKMEFLSPSTGIIAGYNGEIYFTSNSGETWQTIESGTTLHLNNMYFLDANTGFVSGRGMSGCLDPDCNKGSIFMKTSNGGQNWDKVFYDSLAYLESMIFKDPDHGIAVMECYQRPNSKHMFLVKTYNGGINWVKTNIEIPQTTPTALSEVQGIYYLIGPNHNILKSNNYGVSWQSFSTPIAASEDIQIMQFINKDIGFISDGSSVYKTTNGCVNWVKIGTEFSQLRGVHFYNNLEGFGFDLISAYEGGDFPTFKGTYIYSTTNGGLTWTKGELYEKFAFSQLSYPNPGLGYGISGNKLYRLNKK
jgi:photosystem II stability/assembly factor-like uncharacterized protein